jgi:polyphenol oxidase
MIVPNWNVPSNIKAFSSTRQGGFSSAPYHSLNLGAHVGDLIEDVERNRQSICHQLSMPSPPVWLNQTHSTNVIEVDNPTMNILDADGAFTQTRGVICSVMTADCLPVLLTNMEGNQVAAVHAGWRGLAGGILENVVSHFSGEVIAWLGPAIGSAVFEVGDDVVEAFCCADSHAQQAFVARDVQGKWLADLNLLATQRLNKVGVQSISSNQLCTYTDSELFYSYRRDGMTGRQASFIWIE